MRPGSRQRGFSFVATLLLVALVGLGLAIAGPTWAQQAKREREREMLRIGVLYAQALAAYYAASPGADRQYPPSIEALLLDTRFVGTVRHLRKAYGDPVNGYAPWGLVLNDTGRIIGVRSLSQEAPIATAALRLDDRVLPPVSRYADWTFTALPSS